MKKTLLLGVAASMLSFSAMNVNAETTTPSNTATLDMRVSVVPPFEIIKKQYLGFGAVLAGEEGKTVIVTTDGKLDPLSTATMMSEVKIKNYRDSGDVLYGSLNEGLFQIKSSMIKSEYDEETLNLLYKVNFAQNQVNLVDTDTGTTCGSVSGFDARFTPSAEGEMHLHIGGTFTTAKMSAQAYCQGQTTVTIVINEDYMNLVSSVL